MLTWLLFISAMSLLLPLITLAFAAYPMQRRFSISALEHASLFSVLPVLIGGSIGVLLGRCIFL